MERGNGLSLTVTVIILAIFGLFVGYILGNWFIQLVTGGSSEPSQLTSNEKIIEEEIILEDEETEESYSSEFNLQDETSSAKVNQGNELTQEQLRGEVYAVQVGAFNSYNNALSLKEELASKGFQAVITEGIPYKVQLGATTDRQEAEETEKKIEELGYEAFITH